MAEATLGSVSPARREVGSHPVLRQLGRAYLSVGVAVLIFGIGYGLSLLDGLGCRIDGWSCAVPRALLLAGFLAVALAVLVYAAWRTGLGISWFLITAGLAGLVLVAGLPQPLLVIGLILVPGLTASLTALVRQRRRH